MFFRKTLLATVIASAISIPTIVLADTAATAPAATLTSNMNIVSEYRFRGIAQTWGKPAIQGGVDYAHPAGWYAGVWGSNVTERSYPGGNLELDYYAGYNGKLSDDLGWTAGGYGYYYPGANFNKSNAALYTTPNQKFDNFELNAGVSWKYLSYKLSYATTDYFGANTSTGYTGDTDGTLYHDISANYPLADTWTINAHLGHTNYRRKLSSGVNPNYTDYKLGITKTFKDGWLVSAAYVQANNNTAYKHYPSLLSTATYDLNKGTAVVQLGRTF